MIKAILTDNDSIGYNYAKLNYCLDSNGERVGSFVLETFNGVKVSVYAFQIDREEDRGRGYGQRMARELIEFVKTNFQKAKYIWLYAANERAKHVYAKAGFTITRGNEMEYAL